MVGNLRISKIRQGFYTSAKLWMLKIFPRGDENYKHQDTQIELHYTGI